jgi:hypothetical protein
MAERLQVNVRMTEKLLFSLRAAAKFKRLPVSVFVREAIKEKVEKARQEFRESQNA